MIALATQTRFPSHRTDPLLRISDDTVLQPLYFNHIAQFLKTHVLPLSPSSTSTPSSPSTRSRTLARSNSLLGELELDHEEEEGSGEEREEGGEGGKTESVASGGSAYSFEMI